MARKQPINEHTHVSRDSIAGIAAELARVTKLAESILIGATGPQRTSRPVPHFDCVLELDRGGIQALVRDVGCSTLIDALVGSEVAIRNHFLENLNEDTAAVIREEIEEYGPINPEVSNLSKAEIMIILLQAYARRDMTPNGVWLDRLRTYA